MSAAREGRLAGGQGAGRAVAELLVTGRIATLAGHAGPAWAEAIAIADGRVLAAGARPSIEPLAGRGTRRIELTPDEVAIPGLTDSHLHLVDAALARTQVELEGSASIEELVRRIREHATGRDGDAGTGRAASSGPSGWLTGGGWDPDRLGRWPTATDLERAVPGRLVALWAHDHHALLVSQAALRAAGIDGLRADPPGGVVRRDPDGAPAGVLHENAARLVADLVPEPAAPDVEAAVERLVRELLGLGVVAVHDPGGLTAAPGLGTGIAVYRRLAERAVLGVRVHACIRPERLAAAEAAGLRSGDPLGPDPLGRLHLGWLKTFADGSLGSGTAALLAVRERAAGGRQVGGRRQSGRWGHGPGTRGPAGGSGTGSGVWMTSPDGLRVQVSRAASAGIATQIHAIGDGAVRAALDVLAPTAGRLPLMPRIEHAQLVDERDIARFAELGVAASVQPVHLRSDVDKARRLWGARADELAFPLAALARTGAVIAFGTDAPVEPVDPWPGIACAVTRSAPSWPAATPPLAARQAIPMWRAIRAACVDPPVTAGETDRGRLSPGHRADVVVLPAAALGEPVEVGGALWHARPRLVLVDGAPVSGN